MFEFTLISGFCVVLYLSFIWTKRPAEHVRKSYVTPNFNYPALSLEVDRYWVPPGQLVEYEGVEIKSGMFYFGANLRAERTAGCIEPSLVDPTLPVQSGKITAGYLFPDYPYYRFLTPFQRFIYLNWLSHRSDFSIASINVVKLYVYGIERRLISDYYRTNMNPDTIVQLLDELKRVKVEIRDVDEEFAEKVSQLIDWAVYVHRESLFEIGYQTSVTESSTLFRYQFSMKSVDLGIGFEEACEWVIHNDPDIVPEFFATYSDYFYYYFASYFNRKYPEGIRLNPSEIPMHLCYKPIHPGISVVDVFLKRHPDPIWPSVHYVALKDIFIQSSESTLELIEKTTKFAGHPLSLLKASEAMPFGLASDPECQPFKSMYSFFSSLVSDGDPIRNLEIRELISFLSADSAKLNSSTVYNASDFVHLEKLITQMGLTLLPSPSQFLFKYGMKDYFTICLGEFTVGDQQYVQISTFAIMASRCINAVDISLQPQLSDIVLAHFPAASGVDPLFLKALCSWVGVTENIHRHLPVRMEKIDCGAKDEIYKAMKTFLVTLELPKSFRPNLTAIYSLLGKSKDVLVKDVKSGTVKLIA